MDTVAMPVYMEYETAQQQEPEGMKCMGKVK